MKSTPRCALILEDRLKELKRREDVERLRAPLIENNLFPPSKDPSLAVITVEELKKLVRTWKLHEVRGFWKTHPEKEDLIRALLNHMDDQSDLYYEGRVPLRPQSHNPKTHAHSNKKSGRILKPYHGDLFGHRENTDGIIYLSRYTTDKRVDLSTTGGGGGGGGGIFGNKSRFNSFVDKSFFDGGGKDDYNSDDDSDEESRDSHAHNEKRIRIAEQLYKFSTCQGIELNMYEEGAVDALDDFAHLDDPRAHTFCSAILANLSLNPKLPSHMIDSGVIQDVVTPLHHKASLSNEAKLGIAIALYRITLLDSHVLHVYRETREVLESLVKSEDEETSFFAVSSMANVTGAMKLHKVAAHQQSMISGDERQRIVEILMPTVNTLASSKKSYIRVSIVKTIKNFSLYENARITMIESGVCASILKLASYPEVDEYLLEIVTAISNLTSVIEPNNTDGSNHGRETMIREGIVGCVVNLGRKSQSDEVKKLVACAMSNLTGVSSSMIGAVVMNGAARCLVEMSKIVDNFDAGDTIDIRVAAGLTNLTIHTSSIMKLVSSDVHVALMALGNDDSVASLKEAFDLVDSDGGGFIDTSELGLAMDALGRSCSLADVKALVERFDHDGSGQLSYPEFKLLVKWQAENGQELQLKTRQILVATGLCNLLSDASSHDKMVAAGVVEVLDRLTDLQDKAVNLICVKATSNLVANPKIRDEILSRGIFDEWMELIKYKELEICLVCGNALVHISYDVMMKADIVADMISRGILTSIRQMIEVEDSRLDFYCATILCNLLFESANHEALVQQGVLGIIDSLSSDAAGLAETKIRCAAGLERLSGSLSQPSVEGLILSMSILLSHSSVNNVTHYISAAFFSLSTRPECLKMLANDMEIHKLLISMMRGSECDTQIHGAKTLCNLTCDEACAGILLETGFVSDFVVIAILRTNSELIKEICAQSLFNLLHHEQFRGEMVEIGVLWALMKLSKMESKQTQNICAKVLFNFSCYPGMQEKILEHGVPRLLQIATEKKAELVDNQTKQFCAGALCNLAYSKESGSLYAKGGAIGFMKELMDVEDDDNERYCATIFYNLSHCDIDARVTLVQEGAVPLLINLAKSKKEKTIIASLSSIYNLSMCMGARGEMVRDNIAPAIVATLASTSNLKLIELGLAALYHLTCTRSGHNGRSCIQLVQTGIVPSVVSLCKRFGAVSTFVTKLCSRIVLNLARQTVTHDRLVKDNALECLEFFSGCVGKSGLDEAEICKNAIRTFALLCNSPNILGRLIEFDMFDVYCEAMLRSDGSDNGENDRNTAKSKSINNKQSLNNHHENDNDNDGKNLIVEDNNNGNNSGGGDHALNGNDNDKNKGKNDDSVDDDTVDDTDAAHYEEDSDLLLLSQVYLNLSFVSSAVKKLVLKNYFDEMLNKLAEKGEELKANCVKIVKNLLENEHSKVEMLDTSCAGILSRISRSTEDETVVSMCGSILNSMSSTKSTVTYSEGSIVAVLSMFEERHDDVDVVVERALITVAEYESELIVDDVTVPAFEHEKIDPTWDNYVQGGDKVVNALTESKDMPKYVIDPKQIYQLQTAGVFEKIVYERPKFILSTVSLNGENQDLVGAGGDAFAEEKKAETEEEDLEASLFSPLGLGGLSAPIEES